MTDREQQRRHLLKSGKIKVTRKVKVSLFD